MRKITNTKERIRKTPRERFSHLNDEDFIINCRKRRGEARRQITIDTQKFKKEGKYKNLTINNPKFLEERIQRNQRIETLWDDEIKQMDFKQCIIKDMKQVFDSQFNETEIERTLFTSKYILEIIGGDKELGDDIDNSYVYTIQCYENEEEFNNGNDYSGGALVIDGDTESGTQEELLEKYDYITSFISLQN